MSFLKNNRLKILFSHYAVIDKEGFGRTFMLARELAFLDHEVTLFTTLPSSKFKFPFLYEKRDGVNIYAFPDLIPSSFRRTGFGLLSLFLRLVYVLKFKFDIVHGDNGHRPSSGWPCKLHRLIFNSYYVTEWWDFFGKGGQYDDLSLVKKLTKGFYDLLFEVSDKRTADAVVVLSEQMKHRAISEKINFSKISVIQGGSDIRNINFHPTSSAKIKFGLSPESFTFGFIGMNEGELLDILPFIAAVNQLKKNIPVNWFTTGGKLSPSTKLKYGIEQELKEFGWVNYNEYSEVLSSADVFILFQQDNICNATRWPNKLGDYLAAGRMVLTNPVGEIQEICSSHPESIICCPNDQVAIAQLIKDSFFNRERVQSAGSLNRSLATGKYSWQAKGKQLENIYKHTQKNNNE